MYVCVPASSLRAEAEEEASGAPDGAVKPGRALSDPQNPAERGAGAARRVLSQQQQQHHLPW